MPVPQYLVQKHTGKPDISTLYYRQSIGSIESLLSHKGESDNLHVNMDNVGLVLQGKIFQDWGIAAFWGELSRSALEEITNSVRNKVLEFSIQLWKAAPTAGAMDPGSPDPIAPAQVTQIFNTTVYGSANVVGAASHSTFAQSVIAGDSASVRDTLLTAGVGQADVLELEAAIADDPPPAKKGSGFGPSVTKWLGKMAGKAGEGGWKVGVSAGGKLLEEVLMRYYGFK